ncbi:MAG: oligosaccharide flippase family protein, partial [Bacteroidales bacterium]|nr:oligosaccharide flippase family protein [Bacteroidales bacterium]
MIIVEKIKNLFSSKLIKHSFVFVFADFVNKSIPFLLLPILTHYLTPADYGVIASFNSLIAVLAVFIGLSVQGAVNVNYYKLSKDDLGKFIGNVVLILISSTIITSLIVYIFRFQLQEYLQFPWHWFFAAVVMSLGSFLVTINLTLWIAEQQPKKYGAFNILDTLLKLSMSLY